MVSPTTEEGAYTHLRIADHGINDGDVVASFYALYSKLLAAARGASSASSLTYTRALRTIAIHRQSRLLTFVLTIFPHLNDHNVGLLTYAPLPPMPTRQTAGPQIHDTLPAVNERIIDLTVPNTTGPIAVDGNLHHGGRTSQEETEEDAEAGDQGVTSASSALEEDTSACSDSTIPVAESASSADVPSSSDDLMDTSSDSSEERGRYYDGQRWRCEECSEPLATCYCPDGSSTYHCTLCGSEDADMQFCDYCSKCHNAKKGPCGGCWAAANKNSFEGSVASGKEDELSELFWDGFDGIWRCALCHWEVEANSDEEGHCRCPAVGFNNINPSFCRRIELSEYFEYEPADSDSSGADSTDSEPDSGDEEFIEDNGPFIPGVLSLLAGNYDPFERTSVCAPQRMDTDAEATPHVRADAPSKSDGRDIQA
ncbi:MAG: hypothetical protein Q9199_007802 [Rusavskia elegans]